ncbi:TPA: hypothetical protein ACRNW4_003282 [Pseudomonas aeruginosa]|uniref:hypothetical protein n=1 Tax=Pseudomonas aeruginosa TaxID=287 RepID=UPI00022F2DF7|nr:hypothetical protein [Pseudomonas aeruginosa]ERY41895.1 hypothetical protein Q066_01578 [Pseudomonas aeruginosa BL12]MBI8135593.1 hypothetical protein [Pseudomonas aeruginosa]MBI8476212.1 hypothetical protein [Pseudomonas aeruginosa]MBI8665540.1 hypothetical protein [Pseudomonas aeruginosa]MBI8917585.1 hypothetical protein [Pseudomonas aeruginosa]
MEQQLCVEENLVDDSNSNEVKISCPDNNERSVMAHASTTDKQYSSNKDDYFNVIVDSTISLGAAGSSFD